MARDLLARNTFPRPAAQQASAYLMSSVLSCYPIRCTSCETLIDPLFLVRHQNPICPLVSVSRTKRVRQRRHSPPAALFLLPSGPPIDPCKNPPSPRSLLVLAVRTACRKRLNSEHPCRRVNASAHPLVIANGWVSPRHSLISSASVRHGLLHSAVWWRRPLQLGDVCAWFSKNGEMRVALLCQWLADRNPCHLRMYFCTSAHGCASHISLKTLGPDPCRFLAGGG